MSDYTVDERQTAANLLLSEFKRHQRVLARDFLCELRKQQASFQELFPELMKPYLERVREERQGGPLKLIQGGRE